MASRQSKIKKLKPETTTKRHGKTAISNRTGEAVVDGPTKEEAEEVIPKINRVVFQDSMLSFWRQLRKPRDSKHIGKVPKSSHLDATWEIIPSTSSQSGLCSKNSQSNPLNKITKQHSIKRKSQCNPVYKRDHNVILCARNHNAILCKRESQCNPL